MQSSTALAALAALYARVSYHKKDLSSPPPSSPLTPTSPHVLPLDLSDIKPEHVSARNEQPSTTWNLAREAAAPTLIIALLFPVTTALVVLALSTLPITAGIPHTLGDLAQVGRELQGYSDSNSAARWHVLAVLAVTAAWKHAWSVPGSILLNILAGALLNPIVATVYMTLLTSVGSIFSTLLARPLSPLLSHLFPTALGMTRSALEGNSTKATSTNSSSPPWIRLSVLRLIGVVPWSGINVACGVCGVAIWDCFLGAFLGTMPWTAVTVQVGDILQGLASVPSSATTQQTMTEVLATPAVLVKLAFLTLLSLAPILARDRLRWIVGLESKQADTNDAESLDDEVHEKRSSRRWSAWMQDTLRRSRSRSTTSRWSFSSSSRDEEQIPLTDKDETNEP